VPLPWKRHLTCPKCGGAFDYAFIPGASLTAVRLWDRRYMACPICHRWSVFRMTQPTESTSV
jgi:hypothetical protein